MKTSIIKKAMLLACCLRLALKRFQLKSQEASGRQVFEPPESSVRLLFGGDVSFDTDIRTSPYGVYRCKDNPVEERFVGRIKKKIIRTFVRMFFSERLISAKIINASFKEVMVKSKEKEAMRCVTSRDKHAVKFEPNVTFSSFGFEAPFLNIECFLKSKDLVFVNLETPLAKDARTCGLLISDYRYAKSIKKAGINIVNVANNHIFDAGERGFIQTLNHLKEAGICYFGAGENFEDARKGRLVRVDGVDILFLGYTNFCNSNFTSIAGDYPGVLPLDKELVLEDVRKAKSRADLVFVSLHWGVENQPNVHSKQVAFAHLFVDAGADAIIGHHSHIPHGIEIYKDRPIIYSLGNFIFGYSQKGWGDNLEWNDNYLVEIVIDNKIIQGLIVHPVSGKGPELFQPELLHGSRADQLLRELQVKSAFFNTDVSIGSNKGYVKI